MAVSARCLRYLLLFFTMLYGVCGLAEVILTGIVISRVFEFRSLVASGVLQCACVLVGCGTVVLLVAALGFQAASKHSKHMARGYAVLVVLLVAVQLGMAVWALVIRAQLGQGVADRVEDAFQGRGTKDLSSELLWDSLQAKMKCCGVDGPSDFRNGAQVPWSCCFSDAPHEGSCHRLYQRGCIKPLADYVALQLVELAAIAAVASLLQAGGALLAICFSNSMANEKRRSNV